MFTLNRVSALSLGAGLVLIGCASPTGTADEQAVAPLAEDSPEEAKPEEAKKEGAPAEEAKPTTALAQPDPDEANVASKSDAIMAGRWGGVVGVPYGYGYGFYGRPFVGGFYGGVPGYGFGVYRGVGWGTGYGVAYGCGAGFGCAPGIWW